MQLLHPWALILGGAAIGLPLLIHWLTRPRPLRLPLSTIRFVHQAVRQRRARHRLRDVLILLARGLAVACLAAAFARPLTGSHTLVSAEESADATRVIILDCSQSMAAQQRGVELFERGRARAAELLAYRAGLRANLLLAATRTQAAFAGASQNFAALRDALAQAAPQAEPLDVPRAMAVASEILAATPESARRELVIISDFQRSSWGAADFASVPERTVIQLESVAPAEAIDNVALLRAGAVAGVEGGRDTRVEIEVGNFGRAARPVEVELAFGSATRRLSGVCPAYGRLTLSAEVPPEPGWQTGRARLINVDDALPADDERALVAEVRPAPVFALVTRQAADRRPTSSNLLERALVPVLAEGRAARQRVRRVDPAHLDREALAAADALVLDHPGKLSAEAVTLLAAALQRGRPVLYVAAEPTDALNLRALAEAAGDKLRMPVEFLPPSAARPRRALSLAEMRQESAVFAAFGEDLATVTAPLRFAGGLDSRRIDRALADDVLASYNDSSACLVLATCGLGTLAVLNADLSASNLPGSPVFVALVSELTERTLSRPGATAVVCGQPLHAYLPDEAGGRAGLELRGPDGAAPELGELTEEETAVLWRSDAVGVPGVYEVRRERPVFAFAAGIAPSESDLRALSASAFQGQLTGGRQLEFRGAAESEGQRDHWWTWFAVACVVAVLCEIAALWVFRT